MKVYRVCIQPTSLQLTSWQADTLFGSLCWALLYRRGEERLMNFLKPFLDRDPPFLISDGIPKGYLPLPFSVRLQDSRGVTDASSYDREKTLKRIRFLEEAEFEKCCRGGQPNISTGTAELSKSVSQLHSTINRVTGTTTSRDDEAGASLFQLGGWVPSMSNRELSVYISDRSGKSIGEFMELLKDLEITGFGKKKSMGMGAFRITSEPQEWPLPLPPEEANGFVSLSNFVPAKGDPTRGLWQLRIKHGKLGEGFAVGGAPFKKPWVMFEPGSCFLSDGPPRSFYGRMLTGLSDRYPQVVQYGYSLPLPIHLPDDIVGRLRG